MKNYFLQFFGLLSIALAYGPYAFAQNGSSIVQAGDPPVIHTTLIIRTGGNGEEEIGLPDCSDTVRFSICIANLYLLTGVNIGDTYFPLPQNAPDLYLELKVGTNHYSITPLSLFEFSHTESNGTNIYITGIDVDFSAIQGNTDFSATLLKVYEQGDPIFQELPNSYTLPQGYSFYPIWDYRSPEDLFPCDVQGWTNCYYNVEGCEGINTICYHTVPLYYATIRCDSPDGEGGSGGTGERPVGQFGNQDTKQRKQQNPSISNFKDYEITPNPFLSDVNIKFLASESSTVDIDLLDVNGQVIQSWNKVTSKGLNDIHLKMDQVSSGVYFIRLSDKHQNFTKKVLKY